MIKNKKRVNIIAKATLNCNLSCTYCYEKGLHLNKIGSMKSDVVSKALEVFGYGNISKWIWHGGEPLLVEKKWLTDETKKIIKFNPSTNVGIQSNLTLVDDEWIGYFKKYSITPGTSFDGLSNEKTRKNTAAFMKSINKLRQNDIFPGSIMVITNKNVDKIIDEYEYLKVLGIDYKMNLAFETPDNKGSEKINSSKSIEGINNFFDYWILDKNCPHQSSLIESYLRVLYGGNRGKICNFTDCCGKWFCLDPVGDLYPCGRNWPKEYCFGNIRDFNSIEDIYNSPNFISFQKKTEEILEECRDCVLFKNCKGQCFAGNMLSKDGNERKIDCEITKGVVAHIFDVVKNIDINKDYDKYNPLFVRYLLDKGHRSMSLINKLEEYRKSI